MLADHTINEWDVTRHRSSTICHERDVVVHCLVERQTHLQQRCRSLAAVAASATFSVIPCVDFSARFNENKVDITESSFNAETETLQRVRLLNICS